MLTAIVLALFLGSTSKADLVLKCDVDKRGRFKVTQEQIDFIHQELRAEEPERVLAMVHSSGITRRTVYYIYADDIQVERQSLTKEEFEGRVRNEQQAVNSNGTVASVGLYSLTNARWKQTSRDTWGYRLDKDPPRFPGEALDTRELAAAKKYGPIEYVKLWVKDGRLWVKEFGWGHGEGE